MRSQLLIPAILSLIAYGISSQATAEELKSLPIKGTTTEKPAVDTRIQVTIQNKCGKWVLIRISPFSNQESNSSMFKIKVPEGADILIGDRKGKEDSLVFTIKKKFAGNILNVCG